MTFHHWLKLGNISQGSLIKYLRKVFRKSNISYPLIRTREWWVKGNTPSLIPTCCWCYHVDYVYFISWSRLLALHSDLSNQQLNYYRANKQARCGYIKQQKMITCWSSAQMTESFTLCYLCWKLENFLKVFFNMQWGFPNWNIVVSRRLMRLWIGLNFSIYDRFPFNQWSDDTFCHIFISWK